MANAAWLSFDRFDLILNIRRATVTGGYDTVFEFDANFKRTVKIRSPKTGSGRGRRAPRFERFALDELEAGVRPAPKFLKEVMKKHGRPPSVVTDGLCSYPAAMKEIGNAWVTSQTWTSIASANALTALSWKRANTLRARGNTNSKPPKESPICAGSSEP